MEVGRLNGLFFRIFADAKNCCVITESCRFPRTCFKHVSIFARGSMFYCMQRK